MKNKSRKMKVKNMNYFGKPEKEDASLHMVSSKPNL